MTEYETNPEVEVEVNEAPEAEVETDQTDEEQEAEEVETEAEAEEDTEEQQENDEESEDDEVEEEDDLEDAEFEGKNYKLPRELKDALLRQSDYTRKTQELADQRKSFESEQVKLREQAEAQQKEFEAYADIRNIDTQLQEYDKLDWNKIVDEDSTMAMKLDHEFRALQNKKQQLLHEIGQKEQERTLKQQQEFAKLEEENSKALSRDIKGWNDELKGNLTTYASSLGVPKETIDNAFKYDALAVKVLHKAHLYDQLQKKAVQKPKKVEIKKPVTPIKSKNSRATSNAPSDKDSIDAWFKKRNAQLAKS